MRLPIEQNRSKRLIVLIADCQANNHDLAHAVHWMADRERRSVLYLVLGDDCENMLEVSRNMATMKAVTSGNRLPVDVKLVGKGYWIDELRKITSPADVILCQEEQTVVNGLFKTIPIGDFLSSHFSAPVRTISGYYHPFQTQAKKWLHEFFALLGFLVIMAVFTWLQIRLDQAFGGPAAKIYVIVMFGVEMGAIWAWYKFAYR